jgi:hypothetical protein
MRYCPATLLIVGLLLSVVVSNRINLRLNSNQRDIIIGRITRVILFSIEALPIIPNGVCLVVGVVLFALDVFVLCLVSNVGCVSGFSTIDSS